MSSGNKLEYDLRKDFVDALVKSNSLSLIENTARAAGVDKNPKVARRIRELKKELQDERKKNPTGPTETSDRSPIRKTKSIQSNPFQNVTITAEPPRRMLIELKASKSFGKTVVDENTYSVKLDTRNMTKNTLDIHDDLADIENLFEEIFDHIEKDMKPKSDDKIRVFIRSDDLVKPIVVTPTPYGDITVSYIMDQIIHVLNSVESISLDKDFEINLALARVKRREERDEQSEDSSDPDMDMENGDN